MFRDKHNMIRFMVQAKLFLNYFSMLNDVTCVNRILADDTPLFG